MEGKIRRTDGINRHRMKYWGVRGHDLRCRVHERLAHVVYSVSTDRMFVSRGDCHCEIDYFTADTGVPFTRRGSSSRVVFHLVVLAQRRHPTFTVGAKIETWIIDSPSGRLPRSSSPGWSYFTVYYGVLIPWRTWISKHYTRNIVYACSCIGYSAQQRRNANWLLNEPPIIKRMDWSESLL